MIIGHVNIYFEESAAERRFDRSPKHFSITPLKELEIFFNTDSFSLNYIWAEDLLLVSF